MRGKDIILWEKKRREEWKRNKLGKKGTEWSVRDREDKKREIYKWNSEKSWVISIKVWRNKERDKAKV